MARMLIAAGIILVAAGLAIQFGIPLGRLPGDIVIRFTRRSFSEGGRGSGTFYFPIVTCIVVSVVLTIIGAMLRR